MKIFKVNIKVSKKLEAWDIQIKGIASIFKGVIIIFSTRILLLTIFVLDDKYNEKIIDSLLEKKMRIPILTSNLNFYPFIDFLAWY